MYKMIMSFLLMGSMSLVAQDNSLSQDDKKCCKLLNEAALRAEIMLLLKHDDDFPKRRTMHVIQANVPVSLTKEKALQCLEKSYLKHNPQIAITHSLQGQQGAITVKLERIDFDVIMATNLNARRAEYELSQAVFDFYQAGE